MEVNSYSSSVVGDILLGINTNKAPTNEQTSKIKNKLLSSFESYSMFDNLYYTVRGTAFDWLMNHY